MVRSHPGAQILFISPKMLFFIPVKRSFLQFLCSRNFFIIFVICCFCLFFAKAYIGLDPDFGWHLKLSEIVTIQGLPRIEPFSYSMPSHPYVDHEWLLHVVLHPLYTIVSYGGLAFVWAAIILFLCFFYLRMTKSYMQIPLLLLGGVLLTRFGIRAQVISWILSYLLFTVLSDIHRWKRYRWFVPLLFLFWANIHGSILLAVILLTLFIVFLPRTVRERDDVFVWVVSLLVTFINPYGVGLWIEIIQQINQPLVHQHIQEWGMFLNRPELSHLFGATIMGFFFWKYRIPKALHERIITLLLFVMSLSAIRHVPYLLLWISFYIPQGFLQIEHEVKKIKGGTERLSWFYGLLVGICLIIFSFEALFSLKEAFLLRETHYYPTHALQWLQTQDISGNIFTLYEWGGYMDWKYPQKKVFIDGRMPHMKWNAPDGESSHAFADYLSIVEGKDIEYVRKAYDIEYMLLRKPEKEKEVPFFFYLLQEDKKTSLSETLISDGWESVYEDEVSVIYKKLL